MLITLFYMITNHSKKKVFIDLNHPADFHFFKYLIKRMEDKGCSIMVVARDKECLHSLLDEAGINYISRGRGKHNLAGKYLYAVWILMQLLVLLTRFRPGIAMSLSSPYLSILSRFLGITCVTYDDTDYNPRLLPLIKKSTYLLSPATYPYKFHDNHFHLPALKELAYLHPAFFKSELERTGVFFRLTRTDSIHHSTASMLNQNLVIEKMKNMSPHYKIFLSSELDLKLQSINSIKQADTIQIHRDLASCRVFWGNSATMAAEAAVLGIPAIFVSAEKFAYINELEACGLLYYYHPDHLNASFKKLDSILADNPPSNQFQEFHKSLLKEKINMTSFMEWFIENIPNNARILREDPAYALRFISDTLE